MRICIIGAGSMGCLYGALLARSGEKVVLFDKWREHVNAIRQNGLHMTGITGDFTIEIPATSEAGEIGAADLCIVQTNTYATDDAAKIAAGVLNDEGYCLTLQNGVGNIEKLSAVLGRERVMGGLSYHSAALEGPGTVAHTHAGPTWLGELDKTRSARLDKLVEILSKAGFTPTVVDDIEGFIWGKFVHNSAINALCAITGIRVGEISMYGSADEFQSRILDEILAVLSAKNITIPEPDPVGAIKAFCKVKFNRVSMLQHIERGQRSEIDSLNAVVVEEGRKLGIPTPYNEALTLMLRTVDARNAMHAGGTPDFERLEAERKAQAGGG